MISLLDEVGALSGDAIDNGADAELRGWLALAESAFSFWDNEEDTAYDDDGSASMSFTASWRSMMGRRKRIRP